MFRLCLQHIVLLFYQICLNQILFILVIFVVGVINKDVAVIGNGDYAISEAMDLQNVAKSIKILTNGKQIPEYRAENVDIINKEIKEVNRK